jgi:hypothetical protein
MKIIEDAIEDSYTNRELVGYYTAFDADAEARAKFPTAVAAHLAPGDEFFGEMLDAKTGKVWPFKETFCCIEDEPEEIYEDDGFYQMHTLQKYMWSGHFCGCHRLAALVNPDDSVGPDGPVDSDDYCPSGRFVIQNVYSPLLPGVCLLREELKSNISDDIVIQLKTNPPSNCTLELISKEFEDEKKNT